MPAIERDVYFGRPGVARVSWNAQHGMVLVDWEGWADEACFATVDEALEWLRRP